MNNNTKANLLNRFYQFEAPLIMSKLADDIINHIVPIFENKEGKIKILGNRVFIKFNEQFILISAEHVLKHCIGQIIFLFKDKYIHSEDFEVDNHDMLDFGFLLLANNLVELLNENKRYSIPFSYSKICSIVANVLISPQIPIPVQLRTKNQNHYLLNFLRYPNPN